MDQEWNDMQPSLRYAVLAEHSYSKRSEQQPEDNTTNQTWNDMQPSSSNATFTEHSYSKRSEQRNTDNNMDQPWNGMQSSSCFDVLHQNESYGEADINTAESNDILVTLLQAIDE
ncbi:AGAP013474-PA [Anopheles gambiae str. PEST]|uniref:AGAP013474-PA n=2 Tax=gambiae species complex TaxID=44542 RepID=F5HJZ5_ANOGA|nr:AGAP013474-PA [Anopheles gambiae str. PEST]